MSSNQAIRPNSGRKLLVTTALESTWGKSEDILFLGEWCKLYERRHVWAQRNHETVPFHWDDRDKLKRDYDYLKTLHHSLLSSFAHALNEFHQVDHSLRYWQILIDPWLMAYISMAFDRWESLRLAFEKNGELEVIEYADTALVLPPFSYTECIKQATSDEWNEKFYRRIIKYEYSTKCVIHKGNGFYLGQENRRHKVILYAPKKLLKRLVVSVDRLLENCFPKCDVVFLSAYFKIPAFIRLNWAIGQMPRWFGAEFKLVESLSELSLPSTGLPQRAALRLNFKARSAFEKFLQGSLIAELPLCLVEGYTALRDKANHLTIKTKAVVTANDHWGNPLAKAWFAEQVNKGVKLVVLEHGGSFPAYKELFDFEEDISDYKGTWFLPYHPKHVQLPPSRLVKGFPLLYSLFTRRCSRKYCSIIGSESVRWVFRIHFYPMAAQCLVSFDLVVGFYERLNDEIKQATRIKPYPNQGWNTWQRYSDIVGPEKIFLEKRLNRVFRESKLIVCTYPETTFSEAMASDIPVIMIYPKELYERNDDAQPLLDALRSAKIIFHDPWAAAAHLNIIWANPDGWWSSPDVLHARAEFRRQALKLDENWLNEWTAFIKGVLHER